ncbi:tetratricopeptide repeat protein [Aliifodinibius salipaludis]|uniref:tetratricopeptide repeat protein n=1 Tax=Fodinibius salipaludis TaxID=2032627 RepID=UPI0020D05B26|nr:tetratricopeptide repeat protein [Aliifodinibius salipaludis]
MRRIISLLLISILTGFLQLQAQEVQESASQDFDNAVTLFNNGLFEESITELKHFLQTQEDHQLVTTANYYLARAKAKTDSTNKTVHFEEFINDYPFSNYSSKLLFDLGQQADSAGHYKQAETYYSRAQKLGLNNKESAKAYYWMGESAASDSNFVQARQYFMTLADEYPKSKWAPKALYTRGRLYLSETKYDSATTSFEILKDRYPNNEMSRRVGTALGESYYQQGHYQEAIEALKNAMPHLNDELRSKAVYLIAESSNYLGDYDEASRYYKQYINMKEGTDEVRVAHYGLGWLYHKQEIYHWAADEFGKAAEGDDETARKALYYKAVNEKLGSRYADALNTFRTFGDRFQEGLWVEQAYYEWAITAYEVGRHTEAIDALLPLVRSDRELDWKGKVYTLLGEAYFANKEYTRALQAFDAAEKVTDVDPAIKRQAKFQKAWVQYSNQAYEQAQPIFRSVYTEAPDTKLGQESLFWSADALYQMQRYGQAVEQFAEFINRYPDHEMVGPANYALGWSYFKNGDYEQAIDPFKTFYQDYDAPDVALYPYDTDTQLRIGDAYYAINDYENAISYYQDVIGAEPGGDYAMYQMANSYYRDEQTYEAVTTFRRFLRIYPYSQFVEQAQYNIAYIYLNTGNYTQAVEEFQEVINKYPNTEWAARAQYNIGDAYYNAGDYEKAITAYKDVMEGYPQSEYIIEAVNGIQYSQMSLGQADSSSAVLEDFIADHPQTSMADRLRFRQADNRMQSGNYQAAIDEFQQYIRITNNRELLPDAHFNLANAYEQTDQIAKAVDEYEMIVNEFPDSERVGPSLASLGRIAYSRVNYKQSFEYFSRLAEQQQKYREEAYIGMGNAQLAMNNLSEAEKHYQAALDNNADYEAAKVGLAKIAIEKENYQRAQELLSPIAESNTTEVGAEAQYYLGEIHQQQGNFEQAVKAYANVNILYEAFSDWVARALLRQAESYIQMGQRGEARSTLNTLIEDHPETPQAKDAQKLLDSQ